MLRIAIAGSGRLGMSMLEPLLKSRHKVVAIVQDGRRTQGLARPLVPQVARFLGGSLSMTGRAKRLGLPIIWIDRMTEEELAPLRKLDIDLLIVSGFGIILKKRILALPRIGCINCHSSLLPRHRGPNPFSAVLLSDDDVTGVTFHVMDPGIDTGPILDQASIPIRATDTTITIYRRACDTAAARVVDVVDRVEREGLQGVPQDESKACYDAQLCAADSWIQWDRPAIKIERQVRALAPSPAPRFRFRGRTIVVLRAKADATPTEAAPGTVLNHRGFVKVATGAGTLTLLAAFVRMPVPWVWPAPWCKPDPGEILDNGGEVLELEGDVDE